MSYHKEEKKEVKEVVVFKKEWYTCDFCGDTLEENSYLTKRGVIRYRVRKSCLGGGYENSIQVDFCIKCFKGIIVPWLNTLQIVPYESEIDW